ncbi:putative reverse transcriptase domain-containing protein [Tanacetum coccineum]|uniref:Reverse transcriptase domain-containing protein n=1 Tax=Tanacetum coccineum TaxID=301880 RepID=A0ABQ5DGJ1_9ASTR
MEEAVKNWKVPKTPSEIRSFLGLYEWGKEQEEVFQTLKDNLCNAPILSLPDGPKSFVVYCDAVESSISLQHIFDQKELNMCQRRWIELFSDYECEISYHPAQIEAFKEENAQTERLYKLDQQMERKEDKSLYFYGSHMGSISGRWMVYNTFLENVAESLRDANEYEYGLSSLDGWTNYHYSIRRALFEALYERKCRSPVLWDEIRENRLIGLELVQDTTDKVGDRVLLKVSHWKGVIRFGKKGKLAPRYVRPFEILERIGPIAYPLILPEEFSNVSDTFHVSNLKKCLADANLQVPLDEIKIDKTLCIVEEPVEIMDSEVKSLTRSKIPIVKICWNSNRGPEFT